MKGRFRILALSVCLLFTGSMMLHMAGCTPRIQAADLMDGIEANSVEERLPDERFTQAYAEFAIKLFQKTADSSQNALISPLSVMLALAMTANGADGQTKTEMETLLGGGMPLDELNEYLHTLTARLPSDEKYQVDIANSIWFRDQEERLQVVPEFLQKNADYYNAAAYKAAFDEQTLKDINNWVEQNTDGMIDKILDKIDPDAAMYLINALLFEAEWSSKYYKNDISDGEFTAVDGSKRSVEMMNSMERKFIHDSKATGFIKPYFGNQYYFAALLPNEGVSIQDYIASLSGGQFLSALKNADRFSVSVQLPKFSYAYSVSMKDELIDLGLPDAFSMENANFTKLGTSSLGNIYISNVQHKTYISVDELGTKAGAVTKSGMQDESALNEYSVFLDRPFVYAIVDSATNLPVFIGAALDIGK